LGEMKWIKDSKVLPNVKGADERMSRNATEGAAPQNKNNVSTLTKEGRKRWVHASYFRDVWKGCIDHSVV
jgi:hypothetical protein